MKNPNISTTKEIATALSIAPDTATTVGKVKAYTQMKRALKAIRQGKFAYTF